MIDFHQSSASRYQLLMQAAPNETAYTIAKQGFTYHSNQLKSMCNEPNKPRRRGNYLHTDDRDGLHRIAGHRAENAGEKESQAKAFAAALQTGEGTWRKSIYGEQIAKTIAGNNADALIELMETWKDQYGDNKPLVKEMLGDDAINLLAIKSLE